MAPCQNILIGAGGGSDGALGPTRSLWGTHQGVCASGGVDVQMLAEEFPRQLRRRHDLLKGDLGVLPEGRERLVVTIGFQWSGP
jgi:hypothetical protein